jgi:predicted nucleic acid-binding protein
MATYYMDSSALVKRYVAEAGSERVEALASARGADGRPVHVIAVSKIGIVEVAAAVARRGREGSLSAALQDAVLQAFLGDCERRFLMLSVLDEQIRSATGLVRRRPLRGYDALHLATALDLDRHLRGAGLAPVSLVAADGALRQAAEAEGLAVIDPEAAEPSA